MSYWRFVFWDGLAALLSAPVFVWLGWYFGGDLDALIHKLKNGQMTVIGALGLVAIAFIAYRVRKHRSAKREKELAAPAVQEPAPAALFDAPPSLPELGSLPVVEISQPVPVADPLVAAETSSQAISAVPGESDPRIRLN